MRSEVRAYAVVVIQPPEWQPHTKTLMAYTAADAVTQVNLELDKCIPRGKIQSVAPLEIR